MRILTVLAMTMGTALWVATCGGDGGGTGPTPTPPPANQAPVAVGSLGTLTIEVGAEITVNVSSNFNDPDGDALTYAASTSDAAVATASVSGSTVAVTGVGAGTATVTVTATDPGGLSATQTMGVTVEAVNHPPTVVGSIDNQTLSVGDTVMADVAEFFEDPEGDDLTFSAASSDTAVASAAVDGSMITVVALAEGSSTVTVAAMDTADNTGAFEFTVTVEAPNRAPEITDSIPPQMLMVGGTARLNPADYFSDPDDDDLTYAASTSDAAVATASVSGSTVAVTGVGAGTATVTVTATDPGGLSATQTMGVTVEAVNHPPTVVGSIDNQTLSVGDTVMADVAEFFEDPEGDDLTFSAASSDTAVASAAVDGSMITVVALAEGSSTVTVTATDPGGLSATQTMGVTVEAVNHPPTVVGSIDNQTLSVGDTVMADVAEFFEDPEGDDLTFSAASSDTAVASAAVDGSMITVVALAEGSSTVTVAAMDTADNTGAFEFTVTVEAPNRAPEITDSIPPQMLMVGGTARLNPADYFSDPDDDDLTYAASTSDAAVATASVSGSTVAVTGVGAGTATVTVTATDPGGLSATQTMGVTVEAVNHPPTVVGSIDNQTLSVGDTVMADVAEFFEDPEGDDLTFSAASSDTAVASAAVDGSMITVVALAEGSSTVTVAAMDTADNTGAFEFTVTVEAPNRAPEITDSIPPQMLMVGGTARLNPADYFSDPDDDDLTYAAVSSNTGLVTALIDADGMVEIGAQAAGSTIVTVQAQDPEGLTAAQQVEVTVTAPPPAVADTIPTHDMIVDSMVPLDMSPYFDGGDLTYTVMSSDEMVAKGSADGSTMTTTGVGVLENDTTISVAILTVTATNSGGSATQDSIMVRVHQEAYDTLTTIQVNEDGTLAAGSFTLSFCLGVPAVGLNVTTPDGTIVNFKVFWTEWQRAVGGGWVTVQNNTFSNPLTGQSFNICPLKIAEEQFPPGIYRMVGHIALDDVAGFYRSPTIEKTPPES